MYGRSTLRPMSARRQQLSQLSYFFSPRLSTPNPNKCKCPCPKANIITNTPTCNQSRPTTPN
jgi:hypothetical protein